MPNRFEKYGRATQQISQGDPRLKSQTIEAANKAAASNLDPERAAADLRTTNLTNALKSAELRDMTRAESEAKVKDDARIAAAELAASAKDKNVYKLGRAIQQLDEIQNDAADNAGWFETGKSGSFSRKYLGDGYPGFDLGEKTKQIRGFNFVDAIRDMKSQSATGSTGAGGLTETEGKKLEDAVAVLNPNMSHGEFLSQIKSARDFYLDSYRRLGGDDPMVDPTRAKPKERMDRSTQMSGPSGGDKVEASRGFRDEVDPIKRAATLRIGKMLASGASDADILKNLRDSGFNPANTTIDEALRYRRTPQFKQWKRDNPGKAYQMDTRFYTKKVPLTATQNVVNNAAQSPGGAFAISAANAASGNHMDDFARAVGGDQEAVNTGLMLSQTNHPGASFAGDVAGQAMFEAVAGRIPGIHALKGKKFGQLGMDALYGGVNGQGTGDTVGGTLANAGGGVLGRLGGRAVGLGLRGIDTPSLGYLNRAEVPMTIGQISRGSGTTFGDVVGGLEDRAAGLPGFDAFINTARGRGEQGFNREMFRQVGAPSGRAGNGNTGLLGLQDARGIRNDAYSFLDSARMTRDAPYDAANQSLVAGLPALPSFGGEVGRKVDMVNGSFGPDGNLSGRDWQSGVRSLRADRGKLASEPFGDDAAKALGQAETNLSGIVQRQLPGGVEQLNTANRVNANFKTAQAALKGRVAQRNGVLTDPTTLNDVSIRGATKFGGLDNALEGNRPFFDLTTAGMDVMPNQVPDSGTAGRALMYSALYGGALGGIGGVANADQGESLEGGGKGLGIGALALPLLLAGLYSKGGQKGLQRALLAPRKKAVKKLGDIIGHPDTIRGFGRMTSGGVRDLFFNPELEQ